MKFGKREIDTLVCDLDNTLYPPEVMDGMWDGVRRTLISALLAETGQGNVSPELFEEKLREWIALTREVGGWSKAYMALGGSYEVFLNLIQDADRASYLKYDAELIKTVQELSLKGVKIFVFTGSLRCMAEKSLSVILGEHTDLIRGLVGADDLTEGATKPDLQAYQQMRAKFGIDNPGSAVMVDDQFTEIISAKEIGMGGILVGDNLEENKAIADEWIPNIYALMGLFEE